jgi:hypothetical protein
MSFITSIRNYGLAESLFDNIQETFEKIEEKTSEKLKYDMDKLSEDIKKLTNILNKINVDELTDEISEESQEDIEYNVNFMYESIDYMERYLIGEKHRDDLLIPVKDYIRNMYLHSADYKKWANSEEELTKKYVEMLTHPNNSQTFKNQIKRIALGTMSQKEFNKIYQMNKHKMIPLPENKFKSFKDYKDKGDLPRSIQYKP